MSASSDPTAASVPRGGIRMEALTGPALTRALPALAALRIEVFRAWPYLYDGTAEYEAKYVENFARGQGSVIVAAFDGDAIVGVSTGAPMIEHAEAFGKPFAQRGLDLTKIFYLSESVLKASHRGLGIGHAFFDYREAHARALGGFTHAAFCGVVRPETHPLKAQDYVPLDAFWTKRGYQRQDGLVATFEWLDIGASAPSSKPMQFWMKAL